MTQPNQSELERQIRQCFDGNVEESSDSIELFDTDRVIADIVTYITANYTDTNDYVVLEAEMELLKYKLRKAEALLD